MTAQQKTMLQLKGILWGVVVSLGLLAVGGLVLGLITNFTSLTDELPTNLLFILNYAAIFIGGLVTAYRVKTNGWLNGGLVGVIYMLIIIMLGSLWQSVVFSWGLMLRVLLAFIVAGLGGMVGINIV